MAGIDEVLEQLVNDPQFAERLTTDPATALAGYELGEDDLRVLAMQLSRDSGTGGAVEQRTSKSALAAVIGGIADGLDSGRSGPTLAQYAVNGNAPTDDDQPGTDLAVEERSEEVALLLPAVQAAKPVDPPPDPAG